MAGKRTKKVIFLTAFGLALIGMVFWIIWGNTAIEQTTYTVKSEQLPDAFSGYRIAHVSDLHNAQMGENNAKLIAMLEDAKPDMIAITGDLIDCRSTDFETALQFAKDALEIAPCYYVAGNHEARIVTYHNFECRLMELGVVVLENTSAEITRNGETITLLGIPDPSFQTAYLLGDDRTIMQTALQQYSIKPGTFTVLLSHRPELFDIYLEYDMDLVLSGHAHGGQVRLPFVGGVLAPNQGLFPKFDGGLYTQENTAMVVSRGIGNSAFPFRINNRPELIVVELTNIQ